MIRDPLFKPSFISLALAFFKKKRYIKRSKIAQVEYISTPEQTYFKLLNSSQPLLKWHMASRIYDSQYRFTPYLFLYCVKDTPPHDRIALYFTSFTEQFFKIKIAFYSNTNMGVHLFIYNKNELIVEKTLHSSLTHTFFSPLQKDDIRIVLSLKNQTETFRFKLNPIY